MRLLNVFLLVLIVITGFWSCTKDTSDTSQPVPDFVNTSVEVDGKSNPNLVFNNVGVNPLIQLAFSAEIDPGTVAGNVLLNENTGAAVPFTTSLENEGKILAIKVSSPLKSFKTYRISVSSSLKSKQNTSLKHNLQITLSTGLDLSNKFPLISDEQLLDLVQKQTFKYFWDFAHPESGLARERNTSADVVTTGGSGFGIMAIVAAIHRGFISRAEGLARIVKAVDFLKNRAQRFHGAYPHWLNGATGSTIAFSAKDNGADLVETSFLVQGLLTARQFFNGQDPAETNLRNSINSIYHAVEWNWFQKNNEEVLYWHWSPNYNWDMNMKIQGWNEALITYVLAASSTTYTIPTSVYDNGWAKNGAIRNGNVYYGVQLPLGPPNGGPLFFAHYSFLGLNPKGLSDAYANYEMQNTAHTLINYNYCKANPKGYLGYGEDCWGLTASDDINGYLAHEPNNDNSVISPTAALSSMPYTPEASMKALRFFYYKLGDRLWGEYGFYDAFSLQQAWFANSYLAIDQGPIIIMIENYRSGLLWDLFMSCPEVKAGLRKLGFQSPNL